MKKYTLKTEVVTCRTEELSGEEKQWMEAAIAAAGKAYAPYSGLQVGAVAVLADGTQIAGSNQENAAYPSGMCAERVALFAAARPDMPVIALALTAVGNGAQQFPIAPCGACRQVMLEMEQRGGSPMRVLLCGSTCVQMVNSASDLLPLSFDKNHLVKHVS
ncbi:MAG: cytidine deaminase [Tannerella sp.]|jgi:cytidine deaminase|nr:cytidine deaminase [Tannerella sp.]